MRELKDEKTAAQWFVDRTVPGSEMHVMITLLNQHYTDLIIAIAEARPVTGVDVGRAGVVAAALAIEKAKPADRRWNLVRSLLPAAIESTGENRAVHAGVKHLLGEADAAFVAEADPTPKGRTIAAFYTGVAAGAAGRDDEALRDLLVASEGPAMYGPTSWAGSYLYIWRAQEQLGRSPPKK